MHDLTERETTMTNITQLPTDVKPAKKRRRWPFVAALPVVLLVGVAIGQANPETTPAADSSTLGPVGSALRATPGPTVTVTSAPRPAATVKVTSPPVVTTVTKTVTPAACAKALDQADRLEAAFQWETDWIVRYLNAVSEFDVDKLNTMNAEIGPKTDQYAGVIPAYEALAKACRR
jgi:hypothetical protein